MFFFLTKKEKTPRSQQLLEVRGRSGQGAGAWGWLPQLSSRDAFHHRPALPGRLLQSRGCAALPAKSCRQEMLGQRPEEPRLSRRGWARGCHQDGFRAESSNQQLQSRKRSHFLGTVKTHGTAPSLVTPFQILQQAGSCLPRGPAVPRRAWPQAGCAGGAAHTLLAPSRGQAGSPAQGWLPAPAAGSLGAEARVSHREARAAAGAGDAEQPAAPPTQGEPSPLARDNRSPSACREGTAWPLPALPVLTLVTKLPA